MIFVIEGSRTELHCLRSEVGIGSRSQEVSGELDKSAETSAMVVGCLKENSGGLNVLGRCGEEVVVPDKIDDRIMWIISEKYVANDWGKEFRLKDDGNGFVILCSSLLIVFPSFFGFVRFDDNRVEL